MKFMVLRISINVNFVYDSQEERSKANATINKKGGKTKRSTYLHGTILLPLYRLTFYFYLLYTSQLQLII